jgi:leader peptidase (prepilin peptidase)/N-methyltransferase
MPSLGAVASGILAASALNPFERERQSHGRSGPPLQSFLRWGYARIRGREGLGFGDVKLAAAVGAWPPLALIPFCFSLATCPALVTVMFARLRGGSIDATAKLPSGAFLCPALWLVFYASQLSG